MKQYLGYHVGDIVDVECAVANGYRSHVGRILDFSASQHGVVIELRTDAQYLEILLGHGNKIVRKLQPNNFLNPEYYTFLKNLA